jgi:hypothetical protein
MTTINSLKKQFEEDGKSKETIRSYLASFARIAAAVFTKTSNELLADKRSLLSKTRIFRYLHSKNTNMNSRKVLLNGYVNILRKIFDEEEIYKFESELLDLQMLVERRRKNRKPEKMMKILKQINWEGIEKMRDEYGKKLTATYNAKNDLSYLILSLYTLLPPLRQQDYVNTFVLNNVSKYNTEGINYIDLSKKKLVLMYHKTKKTIGIKKIPLPSKLFQIIRNFKKKSKSKWLIPQVTDIKTPMSSVSFTMFFRRMFGYNKNNQDMKIGPSFMRKLYVSRRHNNKNVSLKKLSNDAKYMGHSIMRAHRDYNKIKNINSGSKTSKKKH